MTDGHAAQALTPAQAFDSLYAFCAPALIRQAYLLTGRRERARAAVERAFQLAWQRWPEVARDRDPAGWVRATTYECALSPWHRFIPRRRLPDPPPDPVDRAFQRALLRLPPSYRRTLVLYDGVGLDLPETAAETEASTPAAANRLLHAREAVAARLPELADPAELHRRLVRLASAGHLAAAGSPPSSPSPSALAPSASASSSPSANRPTAGPPIAGPVALRAAGERTSRFWTRSAIALTVIIVGATALTLRTAPTHYLAPVSPGRPVQELPAQGMLGPLSQQELKLSTKLRKEAAGGPARLEPEAR
ncbi:RNA polymerase sigma factor [Streptomyces sp. NRRL S-813]|uniref:RNA polymerase sigma factor n=1 Tax=Streptomyces sp. NRRL S-813 TaxID=1463919 RepID=UPI00099BD240|nr:sigma factor-like helix-turn-helix DNA-binding protein [Streptomyces sp. NRRL S-813]